MQTAHLVALGFVALSGLRGPGPGELDAGSILARMERVYAECDAYRDTSAVKTVFIRDGRKRTVVKPFTTAFVRPDRFRYELLNRRGEEEFDRYLIWGNGRSVRTWWDIRTGVEEESSLERALAAARGVSDASSYTVPDLLMAFADGFLVTYLPNAKRWGDEDLGGTPCYVLRGGTLDEPVNLWIDQQTFLLRRIDEQHVFADFRTEKTTTYDPVLDGEIPESLLVFDPPAPEQAAQDHAWRAFHQPGPDDLDGPGILERMARAYAECRTYRDTGVVRTLTFDEDGRHRTDVLPFTTAFVRPDRFRYECRARRGEEEFDRSLAWRAGEEVRSWWDVRPGIELGPMDKALSPARVWTHCVADRVPMLLGELPGAPVTRPAEADRMQDEDVDGRPCFVLQSRPASITLWIDQETFLLRRAQSFFGQTETTITYEPAIDEEIPESLLVFDPPVPDQR